MPARILLSVDERETEQERERGRARVRERASATKSAYALQAADCINTCESRSSRFSHRVASQHKQRVCSIRRKIIKKTIIDRKPKIASIPQRVWRPLKHPQTKTYTHAHTSIYHYADFVQKNFNICLRSSSSSISIYANCHKTKKKNNFHVLPTISQRSSQRSKQLT